MQPLLYNIWGFSSLKPLLDERSELAISFCVCKIHCILSLLQEFEIYIFFVRQSKKLGNNYKSQKKASKSPMFEYEIYNTRKFRLTRISRIC